MNESSAGMGSKSEAKELQDLIGKLYPYRRCKIPMTEEGVLKNKYKAISRAIFSFL